jgi:hypothetical protein
MDIDWLYVDFSKHITLPDGVSEVSVVVNDAFVAAPTDGWEIWSENEVSTYAEFVAGLLMGGAPRLNLYLYTETPTAEVDLLEAQISLGGSNPDPEPEPEPEPGAGADWRLAWDKVGERFYETGVDRGVLYLDNGSSAVVWNGLVTVSEESSGGVSEHHYDGVKYLDIAANEDFQATVEAFSAPQEFAACDGSKLLAPGLFASQQPRQTFGFSYRTLLGNDVQDIKYGYKLHLVYGVTAISAAKSNSTITQTPSPERRQWTFYTVPPQSGWCYRPTAHFVLDSTEVNPAQLEALESILYGSEGSGPRMPDVPELMELFEVPNCNDNPNI